MYYPGHENVTFLPLFVSLKNWEFVDKLDEIVKNKMNFSCDLLDEMKRKRENQGAKGV